MTTSIMTNKEKSCPALQSQTPPSKARDTGEEFGVDSIFLLDWGVATVVTSAAKAVSILNLFECWGYLVFF